MVSVMRVNSWFWPGIFSICIKACPVTLPIALSEMGSSSAWETGEIPRQSMVRAAHPYACVVIDCVSDCFSESVSTPDSMPARWFYYFVLAHGPLFFVTNRLFLTATGLYLTKARILSEAHHIHSLHNGHLSFKLDVRHRIKIASNID